LKLSDNLFFGDVPTRQKVGQERGDVGATQQGNLFFMLYSFFQQKQHSDHDQRHMVMPASPDTHLIIRHPAGAFSVLKSALHPVSLPLHIGQSLGSRFRRGIAQAVFHRVGRTRFAANDQMPLPSRRFLSVPYPHPLMQDFYLQFSFGRISKRNKLPRLDRLFLQPLIHTPARGLRFQATGFPASGPLGNRHDGRRILRIDPLVFMHVHYKNFASMVQRPQPGGIFPVQTIRSDPGKPDSLPTGLRYHFQRQVVLPFKNPLLLRHIGLAATFPVRHPFLGQIKTKIDRQNALVTTQRRKDPNLAVVHLAKPPNPLPLNAHRVGAFLQISGFIQIKCAVGLASQMAIRIPGDLIHYGPMVPIRVGKKMLQRLRVRVRNDFGHTLHIFLSRLNQTVKVLLRTMTVVVLLGLKISGKPLIKGHKSAGYARQPLVGVFIKLFLSFSCPVGCRSSGGCYT